MGALSFGGSGSGTGGGFDQMCFPVSKRTQNKQCCSLYGGANCGSSAVPANPAPPKPITPSESPGSGANLAFTQSAYGGVIPIVFGSDLITGNIIWASPFVKHTYTDDGTEKFYYSVSIAIALCEAPIDHMLRLYIADQLVLDNTTDTNPDGTPVRDASGVVSSLSADLVSPTSPLVKLAPDQRKTKITVYAGGPEQTPPPAMIAQEGYDLTPAYRGTAFLLIENWLLTDSVPSLAVEVSANTESLYPRLVGSLNNNAVLTQAVEKTLMYLPGYNVYLSGARTFATGANNGLVVWDGNTIEVQKESVMSDHTSDTALQQPAYMRMLTSGNVLLVTGNISAGTGFGTYSPFYDSIIDSIGPVSSNGFHGATSPASSYDGVLISRGIDANGNACDIVICPSFDLTPKSCIAILTITDDGQISYPFFTNSQTRAGLRGYSALWDGDIVGAIATFPKTIADKTPKFIDGAPTLGAHAYYFSRVNNGTSIFVDRVDFDVQGDGTVSVANPRVVNVDEIPITDLVGTNVALAKALFCPSDQTIIVCADVVGAEDVADSIIFKYDPLNVRIVWKTPILGAHFSGSGGYRDLSVVDDVSNDKWAWTDWVSGDVWSVDLDTGAVTDLFDLVAQGMSVPLSGSVASMYNGREDAIISWGQTTGDILYKIFLSRANRAQVPLSTIIKRLLNRVDWRDADISIQGLDSLAVDGYTVSSAGSTLRQAFSELQQVFTFDVVESNGDIVYKQRGGTPVGTVQEVKLQATADGVSPWLQETHEYDLAGARKISVTYRDVDREYKTNVQSVQLPKYDNAIVDADAAIQVQVPIVLDATKARRLAEILLYAKITYQAGFTGALPYGAMQYDPSDVVTFQFNPADGLDDVTIRFRQTTIGADHTFQFTGAREDPDIYIDQVNLFGTLGRYEPQTLPEPPSRVDFTLLELPFFSETVAQDNDARPTTYPVYMTLTSLTQHVKLPKDNITVTTDTDNVTDVPAFAGFPTWGFVSIPPPDHPEFYTTGFNETLTVRMMSTSGATLGSCTDYYDMLNNRSKCLAIVGEEVIQFQTATDLGGGVWQFSVLRRALFGTETGAVGHKTGERFVLLWGADGLFDDRGLRQVNVDLGDGASKILKVSMPLAKNKDQPDLTSRYVALQFRPYMPSAGQINYSAGDAIVSWKRRSRYNGQWTDSGDESGDAPFSDASPLISVPTFDLYLTKDLSTFNPNDDTTYLRKVQVTDALSFTYTAAMQSTDGFVNTTDTLAAVVVQTVNKTGLDDSVGLSFNRGPLVS